MNISIPSTQPFQSNTFGTDVSVTEAKPLSEGDKPEEVPKIFGSVKKEPGWAVWVTGLPASGKSTVIKALKEKLQGLGVESQILESETLRRVLAPKPELSPEERETFYSSMVYVGVLLTNNGVNVIFDATAYKRRWRRAARGLIDKFIEVYIRCPLEVCRERDSKGTYKTTETGETVYAPGAQEEYEEPWDPALVLDCVTDSPDTAAGKIIEVMRQNDFI